MSAQVANQPRPVESRQGAPSRGGNRGRGGHRGSHYRGARTNTKALDSKPPTILPDEKERDVAAVPVADEQSAEGAGDSDDVCWICAEPVKYYSVSECNHRTCHVCALRLRALYKKTDCAFCKDPQPSVIFTVSPDALFSSYATDAIPYKDVKLGITFETQEMMEDTLILLRFNCPDPDCDYIGNGWGDLKLHVRATHGKLMCDLCIRSKKVFAHEHALYPPNLLSIHLPSMHHRPGKTTLKDVNQIEGGIHPLCEFCRECYFSGDELYAHMREKHEECFLCKRNEVRDQYFVNYESLERHFNSIHHPCTQNECQAQKFVVFNSPLDLRAHMVEVHGGDMSSRDKKDARRVPAEFAFEEVGHGGRHGRRDREREREREHEPPPQSHRQQLQTAPPPQAVASVTRPPGSVSRRREAFGGALTTEGSSIPQATSNNNTPGASRPSSPPHAGDTDPAVLERHALFLTRLESVASNPATAVPAVRAATRGYRLSESSARDLISTIWNVLERNLDHTAGIVNAFVDLLDEEEKKQDLLASWRGFALEQRRQFPDLIPTSIGSGYAGIASGRVLDAKHSTATRSSERSSRQVWDRVAQAAGSSSAAVPSLSQVPTQQRLPGKFPALTGGSTPGSTPTPAFRQGQRNTPWSTSSTTGFKAPTALPGSSSSFPSAPESRPTSSSSSLASAKAAAHGGPRQAPPKLSKALFPELPTVANSRQKPQINGNVSLKNILGNSATPAVSAWAGAAAGHPAGQKTPSGANETPATEGDIITAATGKGKKGKAKQKQTLFTLGTFPT
ncbi:hypothetical protein K443DRAFT_612765 [Laccaria amethystina LaAM-08-1]|uniref:RING-type E3 ubiquitin transferase n=1 Tax=Laccaria amethystina LaAM-08-1 TaxID=1095629 RepID=A0A0C9XWM8_9AGAR|nr:hypothetical protein K443DRAFT_612765 [Laccaria amethystina LaAM-08-1]